MEDVVVAIGAIWLVSALIAMIPFSAYTIKGMGNEETGIPGALVVAMALAAAWPITMWIVLADRRDAKAQGQRRPPAAP